VAVGLIESSAVEAPIEASRSIDFIPETGGKLRAIPGGLMEMPVDEYRGCDNLERSLSDLLRDQIWTRPGALVHPPHDLCGLIVQRLSPVPTTNGHLSAFMGNLTLPLISDRLAIQFNKRYVFE